MINTDGVQENFNVKIRRNRTFQDFVNGASLFTIGILFVVVVMLYITQIAFDTNFSWKQIGLEAVILYFATVSISLLSRSYARRKGRSTDKYVKALESVEDNNQIIINNGYSAKAYYYCRAWEEAELRAERARVLASVVISVDEFEEKYIKYNKQELKQRYPELSADELKVILAVKKIKRLKYNETYLTATNAINGRHSPSGGLKTDTVFKIDTARIVVTTAISSLFAVSIIVEVISNPTWETILQCVIKVAMIVVFAAIGVVGGYNFSAHKEARELDEKAAEQTRFIKWCDAAPKKLNRAEERAQIVPAEPVPEKAEAPAAEAPAIEEKATEQAAAESVISYYTVWGANGAQI